jgi:hypothetical protein
VFTVKYGKSAILRSYVKTGIGDCDKIPILCMNPRDKIVIPGLHKKYLSELLLYKFPGLNIYLPRGFTVIKENIKKVYFKSSQHKQKEANIYLISLGQDFFIKLFPHLVRQGVTSDYEFFRRTMNARIPEIDSLTDTFFVIIKSTFIPYLGNQKNVKMIKFIQDDKKGFINYNLDISGNFFDCNIFNNRGDYFKVYIKDQNTTLDLDKVFTIISTVKKAE